MTWIAPAAQLIDEPFLGDERAMLDGWLEAQRTGFLARCSGLRGDQLAERAVPPSPLSLLGLIRHLTDVERTWFRRRLAGQPLDAVYPTKNSAFDDAAPEGAQRDYQALITEWNHVRHTLTNFHLDDTFTHDRYGEMSLRWIYIHLVREYAGHCGHADLLRERIDGVTFS